MTARILKKLSIALALTATTIGAVAPAQARDHDQGRYEQRHDRYDHYDRDGRYDRYGRYSRGPDVNIRYQYDGRGRGGDRYYDRCRNDGAAGTILGAIAGGLIGSSAAGRHGDKTTGVIVGGAVGAVAGRAIDKSGSDCR